jgi:uncharacterized protein (TIGR00255 family)
METWAEANGALQSMTGHGVGEAPLGSVRVQIEIRAVNHRFLDVRVRLPTELAEHGGLVEDEVRKRLKRGRIEVLGRRIGDLVSMPVLDVERARSAYAQLLALRDALSPGEPLPLSLLAAVPDLFTMQGRPDVSATRDALLMATEQACRGVCEMRVREGRALAADLETRIARVVEHVGRIAARTPVVVENARRRLVERLERLLGGAAVPIDPGRVEQEIAVLADRMDATEECTRLRSHADQFRTLLRSGGTDALGRRLDFLLQEMAREANTIGAKSADAEVARWVVELKADIERMREQVQNVM